VATDTGHSTIFKILEDAGIRTVLNTQFLRANDEIRQQCENLMNNPAASYGVSNSKSQKLTPQAAGNMTRRDSIDRIFASAVERRFRRTRVASGA
jgi:hypothetical protein